MLHFDDFVDTFNAIYRRKFEIRAVEAAPGAAAESPSGFALYRIDPAGPKLMARLQPGPDGEISRRDMNTAYVTVGKRDNFPFREYLSMDPEEIKNSLIAAGLIVEVTDSEGKTQFEIFSSAGEQVGRFAVDEQAQEELDGQVVMENRGHAVAMEAAARGDRAIPWGGLERGIAALAEQPQLPPDAQRTAIVNQFERLHGDIKVPQDRVERGLAWGDMPFDYYENSANPESTSGKVAEYRVRAQKPGEEPTRPRRGINVYLHEGGAAITAEGVRALVATAKEAHGEGHGERFKRELFQFPGGDELLAKYSRWEEAQRRERDELEGNDRDNPEDDDEENPDGADELKPSSMLPNGPRGRGEGR